MDKYVRNNAWNSGGDFSNRDLLWYAKGVSKMMGRGLNDTASWWFFAAMHGEYVNPGTAWYPNPPEFPAWGFITNPPTVPTTPLPDQPTQDRFWNQCQHGSWYFLPWHRGYLLALEAQLRADIVSVGGPSDWALPYWNYFGGSNGAQAAIPPAFGQQNLPDGTPNPFYSAMRYGPDANGNIYIPTSAWVASNPPDPNWSYGDVTDECMQNDLYAGTNLSTPAPGFGGPDTGFSHPGSTPHGNMESNPHDLVHVYTGGAISNADYGLMADPGTAALDPIFYLHHSNIDRMWAVWNGAGNANPTASDWLSGPTQQFVMPMPASAPWVFTPNEVKSLTDVDYTYEELTATAKPATTAFATRMLSLGASGTREAFNATVAKIPSPAPTQLLGASTGSITIAGTGSGPVTVQLDTGVQRRLSESLRAASATTPPDRVYLKLENIRGSQDATVVSVFVDLPVDGNAEARRAHHAGEIALFGLRRASVPDGGHGGAGLTSVMDISHLVDQLHLENRLTGTIQVTLSPRRKLAPGTNITVGRLSVYRQPS